MNTCGVLFDLDDTLVAFDAVTNQSWKEVCLEYTTSKPGLDPEALFAAIRKVSDWYWSDPERHRIGRNNMAPARRSIVREAFLTMDLPEADADAVAERYSTVRLENMYCAAGRSVYSRPFAFKRIPARALDQRGWRDPEVQDREI